MVRNYLTRILACVRENLYELLTNIGGVRQGDVSQYRLLANSSNDPLHGYRAAATGRQSAPVTRLLDEHFDQPIHGSSVPPTWDCCWSVERQSTSFTPLEATFIFV